jgi:hypothetical protein
MDQKLILEKSDRYRVLKDIGLISLRECKEFKTRIVLNNPDEWFKVPFDLIESIWPILDPTFNVARSFLFIDLEPKDIDNFFQIDMFGEPGVLRVEYQRTEGLNEVTLNSCLDFYIDLLVNDFFAIKVKKISDFPGYWNPYEFSDINIPSELTKLIKSQFLNFCSGEPFGDKISDPLFWVKEIVLNVKNSKNYIPKNVFDAARNKYIEIDVITSIL